MKELIGKIQDWSRRNENRDAFILIFACGVGCIAGFGAFMLKSIIHYVALGLTLGIRHVQIEWMHAEWWLLVLPLMGILVAVFLQKKVAKSDMVHCTSHLVEYLDSKNYDIPGRLAYDPIIACGITLGFGCSAGAEAPIAYAGAAAGSRVGRAMGLDDEMLRIMVGIGAGAGIAGIFKSPVGGVLFTLEVLRMSMGAIPVIGLLMSCMCASLVCYACTGTSLYLPFNSMASAEVPILWVCLLGVMCGVYSVAYNAISAGMRRFFKSCRKEWMMWVSGGLITGVILLMFPAMYGEGYPIMTQLINGDISGVLALGLMETPVSDTSGFIRVLALMLMLKALATVCSNSAGGVAGDFAPTLFAGAVAGTLFAMVTKAAFGVELPVSLCSLFAMAGAFAGIVHAPVMSIFLAMEMTGASRFFLPITVCAAVSYLIVKLINPAGRYFETHYDDWASLLRKKQD